MAKTGIYLKGREITTRELETLSEGDRDFALIESTAKLQQEMNYTWSAKTKLKRRLNFYRRCVDTMVDRNVFTHELVAGLE